MSFREQLQFNWQRVGFSTPITQINDGNLKNWLNVLDRLPCIGSTTTELDELVRVSVPRLSSKKCDLISSAVDALIPWRKGPFSLFGLEIDAEWRSDLKWKRIVDKIDLSSKRVLDIGSGNGYFGFRMLEAGAETVTGLDSSMLPVMQAALINHFAKLPNIVLPVRFGVDDWALKYDVAFSMGVVYHQRNHRAHIAGLYESLHKGGLAVLETIVADSPIYPKDRYAGMRNVWCIPSLESISDAMTAEGFSSVRVADVTVTTSSEQRTTQFMPFRSLANVLSPTDPKLTIEGYPAPKRAVILAEKH
ncbi:MAG: tRNA 5-methoxyuridine(34)/uridine 5-oxyacetic acid(34) synthase CmoB [Gammaproteobacteria bacterium]|nr:tRNA 5-methoxyuridine(34)/uridine 5-oxyacetic acid(34) synthase CmoB [Gammaproteobacteria bacterium]MYD79627.1 tRNA 5-methoxyuridine(34)/uridine 5-oxyacetic acid(34) synthase CmoB [Gammaproteobacteria bacterium]